MLSLLPVKAVSANGSNPTPMFAYYYIWFDTKSWERAKTDIPLLGKYSSDDRAVMRQHIKWAKEAGITGFIVSWKSTDQLNKRLSSLVEIAAEENFKLAIIYQGLDFNRDPLPISKIASDIDYFIQQYGTNPVFQVYSKPLLIWSGTWKFSAVDISSVTKKVRDRILVLGSEKNVDGYNRISDLVDGDAYYWSSVNPDTYDGYAAKLEKMSQAVHDRQGIWIPPAAPGFDARLVGGTTIVDRKNGDTLRTQINTAQTSSPDMLGIISWNEFSENSQIEPSQNYRGKALEVISGINRLPGPTITDLDSSDPVASFIDPVKSSRVMALGGLLALVLTGSVILFLRQSGRLGFR